MAAKIFRRAYRIPLEDFLEKGRVLHCLSSKPGRRYDVSYDEEEEMLVITFLSRAGKGTYGYMQVTELEARSFYFASSKGKWIWTYLRVRGSKTAHRKPYFRMDD